MNFYIKNRLLFNIKSFYSNATNSTCSKISNSVGLKYKPIKVDLEVGKKYAWFKIINLYLF